MLALVLGIVYCSDVVVSANFTKVREKLSFGTQDNCTFDNPDVDGIVFIHWHIPKSGGTTVRFVLIVVASYIVLS